MPRAARFEHLARPIDIGSVRLKNRMMKNATGFFWDDPATGGFMNDTYIAYYEQLARGGLALASTALQPMQHPWPGPGFRVFGDEYLDGWRRWADAVHRHDCLAFFQLFHLGGMSPLFGKAPPGVAASSIPKEVSPRPHFEVPRTMSVPEIHDVVDLFAQAAERMRRAGLDGTELNGACNHLLNSFLSRAWNMREDEYGPQTIENRTRLFVQIIREIKRRNGSDWPVIALFNGMEPDLEDGITVGESTQFARAFEAAGADAMEVRSEFYTWTDNPARRDSTHFPDVYFYPDRPLRVDDMVEASGWGKAANVRIAGEIKKAVSVPVIVTGKMNWFSGEKAIREGHIDIISMNRQLLADPLAPGKVLQNRLDDIRPCISCMTCFDRGEHFQPVVCRVNAALGREREYAVRPASTRKTVLVVGGGPAGLEAARVAAERGHRVVLYEKERRLGGSLPVASLVKGDHREDLMALAHYLATQAARPASRCTPAYPPRQRSRGSWSPTSSCWPPAAVTRSPTSRGSAAAGCSPASGCTVSSSSPSRRPAPGCCAASLGCGCLWWARTSSSSGDGCTAARPPSSSSIAGAGSPSSTPARRTRSAPGWSTCSSSRTCCTGWPTMASRFSPRCAATR